MKIKQPFSGRFKYILFLSLFFSLLSLQKSNAQETTISGTVLDATDKLPLPGVTVLEKGTSNGQAADFDGNFTIKVNNPKAILLVSYVGYKTQEIALDGRTSLTIELEAEISTLQEVVMVGYGSVKKSDLTGTVNTLDSKEITKRNTTSVLEGIQGNVPGVQISSASGRLGDGYNIVIRGTNSLSGSSTPLYIVDGAPVDDISFLNPRDIERMDILKDASSAAIYGSRGASGVILITTKSGASAKAGINVNFETSAGVKDVARLPEMMDGSKWWYYHQSAYLYTTNGADYMNTTPQQLASSVVGSNNPVLLQRVNNNDTFDWYDAVLQSGIQKNNYLNITGRADNGMSYNLGIGLQNETGNMINESLDKYTLKAGLNHKINKKFSTGVNLTIARTDAQLGSDVAMRDAFRLNPFLSPWAIDENGNEIVGEYVTTPGKLYYPNGTTKAIDKTSTYNPLLTIANTSNEVKRWKVIGNVFFEYKPIEWLTLKTAYSGNYNTYRQGKYAGALSDTGASNGNLASSSITNRDNYNYTWDNQFTINKTLNEVHSFTFLGLQSLYETVTETSFLSSRYQPFDTGYNNVGTGLQSTYDVDSYYSKVSLSSYAMRLNYAFKDRYLLTASNRWDGSSVLSKGNKWESFPSLAVAWKINEESFLKDSKIVNTLKARVSYGYTGNNNVQPYTTLNSLTSQSYYNYGNSDVNGWYPSTLANKDLTWEKTREFNVGVDYGFFNNRVSGSVDVYDRLSKNLIFEQQLPLESGWASTFSNVGSASNKGVEVLLTTKNIKTDKVTWQTTFAFTKNVNKLVSLYGQSEADDVGNNLFIGENIHSYYNYVFDGIWQPDQAAEAASYGQTPGQARVKDLNGDGQITGDDRAILGNSDPKWSGSVNSTLTVGNFDFSFSIITNQGVLAYSEFHENFTNMADRGRQKLNIADWYIPENTAGVPAQYSNTYPQPRNEGTYWNSAGNSLGEKMGYYRDASFVKVKNISVGYNFDSNLMSKLKMKNMRIYANILNPFVFTDYEGYDPEWAAAPFNTARVSSVTYQLGLSVNF
ncbi:TonB-dependent receptor [Flavobacterium sp. NRK F10]|uniref:SusC/RagA family TonB-linked outer membrane protein n=1 Tax=Flavobacterium sp. NRK F10 TaxID=2954931 RepID=UPI0020902203|nr:TonB-dependent receptor [Flavobacterium sp. NRK F10]MCO6176275.1 TonB-dependent receptor [Flavobacterium sp. NRK F10]